MKTTIRKIGPNDVTDILALLGEFAEFEKLSEFVLATEKRFQKALFGDGSFVDGLIAFDDETPVGYALFYPNFSSFRGERGLYLEDIYIRNEYRRSGLGLEMIKQTARTAAERGFERIDFMVLDWNEPAVRFYKKLGAECSDGESHYKFAGRAFHDLAT